MPFVNIVPETLCAAAHNTGALGSSAPGSHAANPAAGTANAG
jgi:hypothetical protein